MIRFASPTFQVHIRLIPLTKIPYLSAALFYLQKISKSKRQWQLKFCAQKHGFSVDKEKKKSTPKSP